MQMCAFVQQASSYTHTVVADKWSCVPFLTSQRHMLLLVTKKVKGAWHSVVQQQSQSDAALHRAEIPTDFPLHLLVTCSNAWHREVRRARHPCSPDRCYCTHSPAPLCPPSRQARVIIIPQGHICNQAENLKGCVAGERGLEVS